MRMRTGACAVLLAWAAAGGLASGQTCPTPHPVVHAPRAEASERLDAYFAKPQGPDTYRALAGLEDPGLDRWEDGVSPFEVTGPQDVALLRRLFPNVAPVGQVFSAWQADACRLEQPLATLKSRIASFGDQDSYVEQWIKVQRAVFSRCQRGSQDVAETLPAPMATRDPTLARLQRQDRAYQAAALLFYQNRPQQAADAFDRIGRRKGPDQAFARYMAVAIRAGTQPKPFGMGYAPLISAQQSIAQAQALLSDPSASDVHPLAYDLIGWIAANDGSVDAHVVQIRMGMAALRQPLSVIIGDPEARRRYAAARYDLDFEFSTFPDRAAFLDGAIPQDHTSSRAMAEVARTDPLARWLVFPISPYQTQAWATVDEVQGMARLKAELSRLSRAGLDPSNPWSHEALAWREHGYDPAGWAMVDREAAASRCGDDRALAAIGPDLFHQVRTALMYGGRSDDPADPAFSAAVTRLERFPFQRSHVYGVTVRESLRYLMATGRLAQARRMRDALGFGRLADDDFMRREGLINVLILLAEDEDHLVPLLSGRSYDMAGLLNRLSIAELRRLAQRSDVAAEDRAAFARLAWTRTYALGRTVDPRLNALMRTLNPDITAGWISRPDTPSTPSNRLVLQDVLATPALNASLDEYGRRHAGGEAFVRGHAVVGVDHNKKDDDNWWCPMAPAYADAAMTNALYVATTAQESWTPPTPDGWTVQQLPNPDPMLDASFVLHAVDPAELAALSRIESAPKRLTEGAIDWVEHPGLFGARRGQAEALALAIQTTRWGCDWAGRHGAYSHAAFDLLHQRFATSQAAARTKYWYDCNGDCRPRDEHLPPETPEARRTFWSQLFGREAKVVAGATP